METATATVTVTLSLFTMAAVLMLVSNIASYQHSKILFFEREKARSLLEIVKKVGFLVSVMTTIAACLVAWIADFRDTAIFGVAGIIIVAVVSALSEEQGYRVFSSTFYILMTMIFASLLG